MGPRLSAAKSVEPVPEADRFLTTPHPRERIELFGHAETEKDLLDIYRSGHLPQAFLIGGQAGIGKATLAWRLARFLLAHPDPASEACQAASDLFVSPDHAVMGQLVSLAHPDFVLLRRGWNEKTKKLYSEIRVDDIRDAIRMFQQAAGQGGYRICILDRAEDLNVSGANALLKLIEEPPARALFLIVAHKPGRLLPTIRSRCQAISPRPLAEADISRIIATLVPPWSDASEADRRAASVGARGSVHDALRLLGGRGLELDARLRPMLEALPRVDWREVHALADQVAQGNSDDYDMMLGSIFDWLDAGVRRRAISGGGIGPRELAGFAHAWEKVAEAARETEALNLDRRPFILSAFSVLAAAAEAASA